MSNEKMKVLEMLQTSVISVEDADRLLETLGESAQKEQTAKRNHVREDGRRMQGKRLIIEIAGEDKGNDLCVNVSVPLVLARYADNIMGNCIPNEANRAMEERGINLKALNIGEIVETFDTLQEDVFHVELEDEDGAITVRVFVE